jgi:predicted GH43/DUF377 family glycosyl hydrolase
MTQGVLLICFGKRGYSYAAYNLAASIKHFNPDIQITLYHDKNTLSHLHNSDVFDQKILLKDSQYAPHGVIDPALIKTSLYDFLPYDETLFLDVDALCFKDLQPLFDELKGVDYMTHVYAQHTIDKGRDFPEMIWAWCDEIWKHFDLDKDSILPATNSSLQFFTKGKKCKQLWDLVRANYANPIPLKNLRWNWGGTQPDELYLNAAMAKLGWKQFPAYIFLGDKHSDMTKEQIRNTHYFMSLYGPRGFTKLTYTEWYDRIRAKEINTPYKVQNILSDKHCNTKGNKAVAKATVNQLPNLKPGLFSIDSASYIIDKSELLQSYSGPNGKPIKPTNYCNPSIIKFGDKIIMTYRMESNPWCSFTKIGICELTDKHGYGQLTVLAGSNKLLTLHSDLKGYSKGFHVEDPRLFIYKDELYLSYTDGYQMAQAKINPETLEASESFYIDKPAKNRTEKNWTFFEHKDNLYSVYQIAPHTIFKMHGPKWERCFEQPFVNKWKWGELRGGTSPIKTKDGYLSFFHSSLDLPGNGRQYFMGAYLFDSEPPFAPIAISKEPLICGEFIPESVPRLSSKIFVVFPGGVIENEFCYSVAFGYNDLQCRIVDISHEVLKENLLVTDLVTAKK